MVDETQAQELPVFDFGRVSAVWGQEFSKVTREVRIGMLLSETRPSDNASIETRMSHNQALVEYLESVEDLDNRTNCLMAQVLVSVPRSWLIQGAPETIDWNDPKNILAWVRNDKYMPLVQMMSTDRQSLKNS
jgi:hypothetical protein